MLRLSSPRLAALAFAAATGAAFASGAGGASAAANCTAGKEKVGCKVTVGGYYDQKTSIVVGTIGSGTPNHITIQVPGSAICGDAAAAYELDLTSTKSAVVGKSVVVKKATASYNGSEVKGTVNASYTVDFTSAKKATIKGSGSFTLADGTACSATLKKTSLGRVLGG